MPSTSIPTSSRSAKPSADKRKSKKPYHIPRSSLDIPGFIEERDSRRPSLLLTNFYYKLRTSRQFHLYVLLQALTATIGYGQVMFIVGLFWAMLANTRKRQKGEMSAYSLFNPGVEGIMGSTDMEALEQELRTRGV
ncbi:MAG: hypothetical protein M1820_007773 [Bogoriella megaspora]|nr:MAG: hypothetical protein M1820_007773 [Bogoriella megaspora]